MVGMQICDLAQDRRKEHPMRLSKTSPSPLLTFPASQQCQCHIGGGREGEEGAEEKLFSRGVKTLLSVACAPSPSSPFGCELKTFASRPPEQERGEKAADLF